jgi:hypothetical protein
MTALGAPVAPARVDATRIRRTYEAVLGDPRIGPPRLADEEQRAHFAGLLRGHMWLLLPPVERLLPGMAGTFNRSAARHVIARARGVLAVPVLGASSADDLFDLATLSRALLTLYAHPDDHEGGAAPWRRIGSPVTAGSGASAPECR